MHHASTPEHVRTLPEAVSIDRHQVWRQLKSKLATLEERAAEGFAPVVHVYLLGRETPIQLGTVETSKSEGEAFTWLQAAGSVLANAEESERRPHPDGEWILVPHAHIARIEVSYSPDLGLPRVKFVDQPSSDE